MKREILRHLFGALYSADYDRDICLLGDLEDTVVEREKAFAEDPQEEEADEPFTEEEAEEILGACQNRERDLEEAGE